MKDTAINERIRAVEVGLSDLKDVVIDLRDNHLHELKVKIEFVEQGMNSGFVNVNNKFNDTENQINKINLTIAKWAGAGIAILGIANYVLRIK